jgi:hypothetical protein
MKTSIFNSKLSRYEQETIIVYNAKEDIADISTYDPIMVKKFLNHKDFEISEQIKNSNGKIIGILGHAPKGQITLQRKRKISSEHKKILCERLKFARLSKNKKAQ